MRVITGNRLRKKQASVYMIKKNHESYNPQTGGIIGKKRAVVGELVHANAKG